MMDDGPVLAEVYDFPDLEFLIGRGKDVVRDRPVPFVHRELHPDLVDPFGPDRVDRFRLRSADPPARRFDCGDRDPRVAQIELFSDRDVLVRREFEGRLLRAVEPGQDEGDHDRLWFARHDVRGRVALRAPHDAFEDDFILPRNLAAEDPVRHDLAAVRTLEDQGARRRHRRCSERTGPSKDLPPWPRSLARTHTNLSRILAIFSAAWPSPKDFDFVPSGLKFRIAWRMSSVSLPTRAFHPSSIVSIHSVSSRRVTHATPKK